MLQKAMIKIDELKSPASRPGTRTKNPQRLCRPLRVAHDEHVVYSARRADTEKPDPAAGAACAAAARWCTTPPERCPCAAAAVRRLVRDRKSVV